MELCSKCGSLMAPKKEGEKKILTCLKCGHKKNSGSEHKLSEAATKAKEVTIVDPADDISHPETEQECPKCGNNKAQYWIQQTRASDEPATRFYKCSSCKHIWREY